MSDTQISKEECGRLREQYRDGKSGRQIASGGSMNRQTVYYHIFGRCTHDIPTPPNESPNRGQIATAEVCADLRKEYREGRIGPDELSERTGAAPHVIYRHLTGRCRHGDATPPVSDYRERSTVTKDECAGFRWRYKNGLSTSKIADGSRWGMSIVCHHVFGKEKCSHKIDDEPPADKNADYLGRGNRSRQRTEGV